MGIADFETYFNKIKNMLDNVNDFLHEHRKRKQDFNYRGKIKS